MFFHTSIVVHPVLFVSVPVARGARFSPCASCRQVLRAQASSCVVHHNDTFLPPRSRLTYLHQSTDEEFPGFVVVASCKDALNCPLQNIDHCVDPNDQGISDSELDGSDATDNEIYDEDFAANNNELYHPNYQGKFSIGIPVDYFPASLINWPRDLKKPKKLNSSEQGRSTYSYSGAMGIVDQPSAIPSSALTSSVDLSLLPQLSLQESGTSLPSWDNLCVLLKSSRIREVKSLIRHSNWGLNHKIRGDLWRGLCEFHAKEEFSDYHYWDMVQVVYGTKDLSECHSSLPSYIDKSYVASQALSSHGVAVCGRVLAVLDYTYPAITYAPTIYPIAAFLLHYMSETDAYNCLAVLISSSGTTFISQTKLLHEASWRAALVLAKKYVRGSTAALKKFRVSQDQLEVAFQKWLCWIFVYLPFNHVVRILDCFFLEGSKVLLRFGLAIFHYFLKAASRDRSLIVSSSGAGLSEAVAKFCCSIQVTPARLTKAAFGIRGFSKSDIRKVVLQMEMQLKSEKAPFQEEWLARSNSLDGLPTSQAQLEVEMVSHTLAIKELLTVWTWLPVRMTMQQPVLLYTTEEHGSSLTTFYQRVENHEPTLLLVRTTTNYVFGAYCSSAWSNRKSRDEFGNRQTYFGTGETFIFSLRPTTIKYEWVGIARQRGDATKTSVDHSSELFMHADNDMISIGGGQGHGIWLDRELQFGKTERCLTFNNEPFCPGGDFDIKVLEVYGLGLG